MLGCTFGWGAPMGYAAARGRLDSTAVLLYGAAICWILGYDTIYAHQDRQDDARIGVRSTARLFADHSRPMLACCYAGTIALLAAAGAVASLHTWFWVLLAAAAGLLIRQVVLLDIHDSAECLKLFKANRDVGLLIALALAVGRW